MSVTHSSDNASIEVFVPDIGGFADVSVIDVLVQDGQRIDKETPLITIETEKAAMDVPAPAAGLVKQVKLKRGDKVSEGSLILVLEAAAGAASPAGVGVAAAPTSEPAPPAVAATSAPAPRAVPAAAAPVAASPPAAAAPSIPAFAVDETAFSRAHASPSVRKFARELGVDLGRIPGTGPKGRITVEDVKAQVKRLLTTPVAPVSALPKVPEVDFAKFGAIELEAVSRIQKISRARLHASWVNLPHVTQHEDADITALEADRGAQKAQAAQQNLRLTPLAYIVKAVVQALKDFPRFNASLDASGENLVLKKYFHIGFAADTPNGLVVPVIRDADKLSLFEIAAALASLSEKARAGKLTAAEMQGGSFTISSLGGIGGTYFTPIINAPEVAILGVSRSSFKPVYDNGVFVPRLTLPLSLSYDHRVIDGAAAARFAVHLAKLLGNPAALR
jgi:pyruvate dehydrogenase E2 component (dihydrolipoamide acetyltransferase)